MRVLQLIDSLAVGGAERMAVNYANGLSERIGLSALVATREEGVLKSQLNNQISYLFLNRKNTLDYRALLRLKAFVKENKIATIHAHGTSFFIAFLLKIIYPRIRIIWHEHYGGRVEQSLLSNWILFICTRFFESIFVVNLQLEQWVKKTLCFKNVFFIPNFATINEDVIKTTFLQGEVGKRVVLLANLKKPKNHMAILSAFQELQLQRLGWSLHCVGKIYNDRYSDDIKEYISNNELEDSIFLIDVRNDISHILSQATIGVLVSTAEGFPVSLLEYGLAKLAVVSTNVGYCSEVINEGVNGLLFNPTNPNELECQLSKIIDEPVSSRMQFGLNLQKLVKERYLEENIITTLFLHYRRK
ncbi:alpha-1,4-N-acetylgalactosamine transferase [Flavobacterium sp. ALD4]|uniref:glycosyltransferase n=1 Tax=Flavobacterium sp. ALD4 TaxID=2058314 RepID=UPI000C31BA4C|nr:glycosyltransferase [Flavobacterium sp. ALD4]PKH67693.1 alpha-1,4-N-acetylgalactosamine transferase [Flavobacterium sp. ALD4]